MKRGLVDDLHIRDGCYQHRTREVGSYDLIYPDCWERRFKENTPSSPLN